MEHAPQERRGRSGGGRGIAIPEDGCSNGFCEFLSLGSDQPIDIQMLNCQPRHFLEAGMSNGEKSYFAEGGVQVTNKRAIFHSKTYAMRNISSVSLGRIAAKRALGIMIILAGVAIAVCAGGGGVLAGAGIRTRCGRRRWGGSMATERPVRRPIVEFVR